MKKNTKKFSSLIAVIFAALLIGITILSNNTDSEHYSAGNSKEEINETEKHKDDTDTSKKDTAEADKEKEDNSKEEPSTGTNEDIFAGYTLIEVDGGDLSGHREPNVVVDIGFGDREYYAFTNEYGQLVKVIAKEIILQDDSTEPVTSSGRYYRDEAKVPGVESKNLDEGHVIADSLGGVSNAYNITPQNSTLNRHGDQAYMEKVIRDAGGCTDFVAIITYPDTTTQIPSHYSYTYTINGNVIKDEFDNINPDEYNASLENNTSTGNPSSSNNTSTTVDNSSSGSNTTTQVDNSNTGSNENTNSSNGGSTSTSGTVYWTPNGKSYHTTKNCSTLSRSKTILEGTIAESGKNDPCDRCH